MNCWLVALLTVSVYIAVTSASEDDELKAHCNVEPNFSQDIVLDQKVYGTINIKQDTSAATQVSKWTVNLRGFLTTDEYKQHGMHVHTLGDMTNYCYSTKGHYNPKGVNHSKPSAAVRHVGDLGNFDKKADGTISATFEDKVALLNGDDSIIGRSVVIHLKNDDLGLGGDLGSLANGNAGARIACCVIKKGASGAAISRPSFYFLFLMAVVYALLRI